MARIYKIFDSLDLKPGDIPMIVTSRDGKKINKVYILNNCKPMGDYSNNPKEVDITFSCNSVHNELLDPLASKLIDNIRSLDVDGSVNERLGYLQWLSGLPNKEE